MTRKRALILLGVTTVAIGVYLSVLDGRMRDAGGPGIVGFEFAWSEEGAAEILDDWGDDGQDAARTSLWVDYAYLLAYGAFLVLAAAATRDLSTRRGWRRMAAFGVAAVPFAAAGAAFDAIEDLCLLLALDQHGGDLAPALAGIAASFKFLLTGVAIVYIVAGLALRLRHRSASGAA